MEAIRKAWQKSYVATEGEHKGYRVVKEGKKELFWGDFLSNKMRYLSGKEQEHIKRHLPLQESDAGALGKDHLVTAALETSTGENLKKDGTELPVRLSEKARQARILELEREIVALKRKRRIRELERQIAEAKSRKL